jgi:hypothetical protein
MVRAMVEDRVRWLSRSLEGWPEREMRFFLAGGALASKASEIADLDIFPVPGAEPVTLEPAKVVSRTKNAVTWATGPWPTQVCAYRHQTLTELVESFDFSSAQIGAEIMSVDRRWAVCSVHATDAFVASRLRGSLEFTGSAYPLSSLIRLFKYHRSGRASRRDAIAAAIGILTAISRRGFKDWADFLDQLDAVDLGLVPEELDGVVRSDLTALYEAFRK